MYAVTNFSLLTTYSFRQSDFRLCMILIQTQATRYLLLSCTQVMANMASCYVPNPILRLRLPPLPPLPLPLFFFFFFSFFYCFFFPCRSPLATYGPAHAGVVLLIDASRAAVAAPPHGSSLLVAGPLDITAGRLHEVRMQGSWHYAVVHAGTVSLRHVVRQICHQPDLLVFVSNVK